MMRIRTIKPSFFSDVKLGQVSINARLLFAGLWCVSDDYGFLLGHESYLKGQIFPYDDNITAESIAKMIKELQGIDAIQVFEFNRENFIYIKNLDIHQRIDKPSKTGVISAAKIAQALNCEVPTTYQEYKSLVPEFIAKVTANYSNAQSELPLETKSVPSVKQKNKEEIKKEYTKQELVKLIKDDKVKDIDYYVQLWNIFAVEYGMPKVEKITDGRKRKFRTRIKEESFDFVRILSIAAHSELILSGNWFTFDFILENDTNYMKVLEGKYKSKTQPQVIQKPTRDIRQEKDSNILNEILNDSNGK